jgi:hypothetical protein
VDTGLRGGGVMGWLRKRIVLVSMVEQRKRLAAAYRAGWDDRGMGQPFRAGYWIDRSQSPVRDLDGTA